MEFSVKKILVVEDDNMLRGIIVSQLNTKYFVLEAKDGEEAVQQLELSRPNLVVLDLLLPKLDGFGVLEKLRAMSDPVMAATPVLIVSNLNDAQSMQRAEKLKVEAYFLKADVSMGILVKRVDRILNPSADQT